LFFFESKKKGMLGYNFQTWVLIIAFIVLFVTLITAAFAFKKTVSGQGQQWPPFVADCPDYWVDRGTNGSKCVNTHNLGKCPGTMGKSMQCRLGWINV
jgi:hypothetical protein